MPDNAAAMPDNTRGHDRGAARQTRLIRSIAHFLAGASGRRWRDLERLIMEHPKVGLRFLEQLSARLLETERIVEDFAFKSVPARLAGVLLRLAEAAEGDTIQASHQELADMIATYRETVTLTLDEFQKRGMLELGRRNVRILDTRALHAVAET